ncbi:amylo-alpha-1,6-glucosidase [Methylobacterium nonmethylotrophicum]|uniref:Glycogen debranching protein n=1 Tax=Methylobacterium nonmethylotrophicum TaxID=1141884 RepID=A0A4Z0NLG7_9HYPH|nr:amylo-alpha-1,6-glucosidase [Methylobacterium nonmethylotrophicum]TGD96770.1 glycogen debranching protein [Methylobacterium nonmethylotrophicum]
MDGPADGREWLEADGLGGFASGPAFGPRTRRYHALLLTATTPPTGRVVLVNGIEAAVATAGGAFPLSTQRYAPDVLHPDGWRHVTAFSNRPWPRWTFALPDGTTILHEVLVEPDSCETLLRWQRLAGDGPCTLSVRPLLSGRDYHALHHENPAFAFAATVRGGNVAWRPYPDLPAVAALTNGTYAHAPDWYRNFLYVAERERGLDDTEDLASPGSFAFDLAAGAGVMILRSGDGLTVRAGPHAERLVAAERARRAALTPLALAAGAYRVDRPGGRTLVAGFPWFTDWGRDTFIALRGLLVATGALAQARAILLAWAGAVSEGMMPNRFPDRGEAPEYNAVDASLWYVVAVHDVLAAHAAAGHPVPEAEAARLAEACAAILDGYAAGTRYGIAADADGLLRAGVPGVQLTWMDAKVGDRVITPRIGKPVEIQALWINALRIGIARWSPRWRALEQRASAGFARFVSPSGALYDVIDADHVPGAVDPRVRPNQILAVGGLPHPLLAGAQARAVVDTVEARLLTPLGLRSLDPADPDYRGRYGGGPAERDGAYHQGTVWPWLIGPFVDAWLGVRGRSAEARAEARSRFLPPLAAHLEEAGLGHVSEVVDGDPPHRPGGCPFQAWSLGELIRVRRMLDLDPV